MKTTFLVAFVALLAGCVSVKPVYLADGSVGHSISCNGAIQNMGACIEKAGELCGASGYAIVDERGASSPYYQSQGGLKADQKLAVGGYTSTAGSMVTRNLFVKCNK